MFLFILVPVILFNSLLLSNLLEFYISLQILFVELLKRLYHIKVIFFLTRTRIFLTKSPKANLEPTRQYLYAVGSISIQIERSSAINSTEARWHKKKLNLSVSMEALYAQEYMRNIQYGKEKKKLALRSTVKL